MRKESVLIVCLAAGLFLLAPGALADWSPVKRLTWTSGESSSPAMAIDSDLNIHAAWCDKTPGNAEIYYKGSSDGGATWSAAKRLTWNSGDSLFPAMAIDSDNTIHLAWEDYSLPNSEILYRRSEDGGTTWSPVRRLTWTSGQSFNATMAIGSGHVIHLAWDDDTPGNREIYYKRSTDGGTTWSPVRRLTWTSGGSISPEMAVSSGQSIHLAWYDETPGDPEIYHRGSTDGGATWGLVQRITWTSGWSGFPAIAMDSAADVHVSWCDDTPGDPEIYYTRSTDGGTTWSPAQRLTWAPGSSRNPALAAEADKTIHLLWNDSFPGNYEIYYKRSLDGGATWGPDQRLTWTPGDSRVPTMAVDLNGTIHITWHDDSPGNREIYYKNGK